MAEFSLTSEQLAVLDASRRGVRRLKIEALAGTGKTSTLVELAKDLKIRRSSQKTLYVAFNRFVVEEVSVRVGRFADAMTVNSLALKMVGHEYADKLSETPQRMSALQAADLLGIPSDLVYTVDFEHPNGVTGSKEFRVSRERLAGMASRAVLAFCASIDQELTASYFDDSVWLGPQIGWVPVPLEVTDMMLGYAQALWDDLGDPSSRRFRFRHEHYMKLWHLSDPVIPYDTILFDEAQDADPLMRDVVERHPGGVVWCGDRFQAIYGWRGAVNAMQEVDADETLYLTKSFRFASGVADVANEFLRPLGGRTVVGAGSHGSVVSESTTPDVEIFRKNATLLERFMELTEESVAVRTDVDLGEYERAVVALISLRSGTRPRHADLSEFATFQALNEWLKDPEVEDDEFRVMVRQILRHDLDALRASLAKARESHSSSRGRLLTTAHKVKGLGFDRVVVADDFPAFSPSDRRVNPMHLSGVANTDPPSSGRGAGKYVLVSGPGSQDPVWWLCPSPEEWHLAYVAVTRAQRELVHPFTHVLDNAGVREALASMAVENSVRPVVTDQFDDTRGQARPSVVDGLYRAKDADVVVAGTSFCQQALESLTTTARRDEDGWHVSAVIAREPDNKFDPNAVVVLVSGVKVGYIPKELAPTVGTLLGDVWFEVPGLVVGGYVHNGKKASFGFRLFLGWEL